MDPGETCRATYQLLGWQQETLAQELRDPFLSSAQLAEHSWESYLTFGEASNIIQSAQEITESFPASRCLDFYI